jgi:hypothetical protein
LENGGNANAVDLSFHRSTRRVGPSRPETVSDGGVLRASPKEKTRDGGLKRHYPLMRFGE